MSLSLRLTRFYLSYIGVYSITGATVSFLTNEQQKLDPGRAFLKGALIGGSLGATVIGPFMLGGYVYYDINRKLSGV